jgi:hypothetical protein
MVLGIRCDHGNVGNLLVLVPKPSGHASTHQDVPVFNFGNVSVFISSLKKRGHMQKECMLERAVMQEEPMDEQQSFNRAQVFVCEWSVCVFDRKDTRLERTSLDETETTTVVLGKFLKASRCSRRIIGASKASYNLISADHLIKYTRHKLTHQERKKAWLFGFFAAEIMLGPCTILYSVEGTLR